MDTSKEYIKMCERAEEIQENNEWDRDVSYMYVPRKGKSYCLVLKRVPSILFEEMKNESIWLPRQDQLQEMVKKRLTDTELIADFNGELDFWFEFSYSKNSEEDDRLNMCKWSMEQLWLAFVMKKKFRKVWNGENWERGDW